MQNFIKVDSPLVKHYISVIRDKNSNKNEFSDGIENLVYLMLPQITNGLMLSETRINTPLTETSGYFFADKVLLIPVLRAGLAMLDPIKKIIPQTAVGYIGMRREESGKTITAEMYYENLPPNLDSYKIMLLDCIIATGVSLIHTIKHLIDKGANQKNISIVSIMMAQPGLDALLAEFPEITIATCQVDEILNEKGYIVPGLGDAGNRYNGYDIN